jgi:hypothetical protein
VRIGIDQDHVALLVAGEEDRVDRVIGYPVDREDLEEWIDDSTVARADRLVYGVLECVAECASPCRNQCGAATATFYPEDYPKADEASPIRTPLSCSKANRNRHDPPVLMP